MKRQFVSSLQEGDVVNDSFLAVRKDLRDQQTGGKFLGMVFRDRSGEIGGILWNNAVAISRLFKLGDVVNVRGTVTSYQGRLQIRVDQVLPLREHEYDPADLVVTPEETDETFARFHTMLETVQDEWLCTLIHKFLEDDTFMALFRAAPAGKKWHHAYRGGLVRHCYEMTRLAETMCELFPSLDRDLLIAAILLHDVGKLEELSQGLLVEYTTAGKLLGHLTIGIDMVDEKIDAIEGFPENLRLQLLHAIISHHGELVNASPVVPKTLEAVVLYHLDNMDAQADAFTRVIAETKDRKLPWSDYINLIDRQIWTKEE